MMLGQSGHTKKESNAEELLQGLPLRGSEQRRDFCFDADKK